MKQAVMCPNCGKIKRISETYVVKVKEQLVNLLTNQRQQNEYQTRICRDCAREAGYKVKKD